MIRRILGSLALLAMAGPARAQSIRLALNAESRLWLDGASNVHSWKCSTSALDATIDVDRTFATAADFSKTLQKVRVEVPVESIRCGHGSMDRDVHRALEAGERPQTRSIVATFRRVSDVPDGRTIRMNGTLRVAGEQRDVEIEITAVELPGGAVEAEGSIPILMTDFGIKPPTAFFGMVRADDRVTVSFRLRADAPADVASIAER